MEMLNMAGVKEIVFLSLPRITLSVFLKIQSPLHSVDKSRRMSAPHQNRITWKETT